MPKSRCSKSWRILSETGGRVTCCGRNSSAQLSTQKKHKNGYATSLIEDIGQKLDKQTELLERQIELLESLVATNDYEIPNSMMEAVGISDAVQQKIGEFVQRNVLSRRSMANIAVA